MSPSPSFPKLEVPPAGDLQCRPPAAPRARHRAPRLTALGRSVWFVPALKIVGFFSMLTCIAWFGERSRDEIIYGPALAQPPADEKPTLAKAPEPPAVAAPPPCAPTASSEPPRARTTALLPDGRLVLNEATAEDLDRLPGIGQKRALDIVALRTRLGRFKRLSDLLRVRGIGPRSLATLQEHLVLDRPSAPQAPIPSGGPTEPTNPARSGEMPSNQPAPSDTPPSGPARNEGGPSEPAR